MDPTFWHQKWERSDISFHQGEPNPLLVSHFNRLSLVKGSRLFLPLCGKTLDIAWLLAGGYRVAGAELSELAIRQLFTELGIEPRVTATGQLKHYSANNIDIFVGDIFDLKNELLGPVDATYDRAALVALPAAMRNRYAAHLMAITNNAPQLLIAFEYDQSVMEGPPFSVDGAEVNRHYGNSYQPRLIASTELPGGLKGKCPAKENVWLLQKG